MSKKIYQVSVPYSEEQTCFCAGTAFAEIEAESEEEALEYFKAELDLGIFDLDFIEHSCDVVGSLDTEYDLEGIKIESF